MTYEESKPLAEKLAINALSKGFDADAFIILTLLEKEKAGQDLIPESNVDEQINDINGLFLEYYNNRCSNSLQCLLSKLRSLLSELYHTLETSQERELYCTFLSTLSTITCKQVF